MTQLVPSVELVEQPERLLAALGVQISQLPIELYDNGLRYVTWRSRAKRPSPPSGPTRALSHNSTSSERTASRVRGAAGRRACSLRRRSPRIRRPDRPQARSPATWLGTAASRSGTRSRSPRSRRGKAPEQALRASRELGADRAGRRRRLGRHRRTRRVPPLRSALDAGCRVGSSALSRLCRFPYGRRTAQALSAWVR